MRVTKPDSAASLAATCTVEKKATQPYKAPIKDEEENHIQLSQEVLLWERSVRGL
jgi:hypothetical protein